MSEKEIKKRNHFASLERREKEKAEKDKLARSKGEKTESELNQWWKYRKSTKTKTNKQQFLTDMKEELVRLKLRRFKKKQANELVVRNGEVITASELETDEEKIKKFKEKQELQSLVDLAFNKRLRGE